MIGSGLWARLDPARRWRQLLTGAGADETDRGEGDLREYEVRFGWHRGDVGFVPWTEITAVVVSEVLHGGHRYDRVGVVRRNEPVEVPACPARDALDELAEIRTAPSTSVTAGVWRLDMGRLRLAVELNAPETRLVDLRD